MVTVTVWKMVFKYVDIELHNFSLLPSNHYQIFQYLFVRLIISYKAVDVFSHFLIKFCIGKLHTPSLQGALQNPFRSLGVFLEKYLLPIMWKSKMLQKLLMLRVFFLHTSFWLNIIYKECCLARNRLLLWSFQIY